MAGRSEPPVERAACPCALVVPANVVAEQVVREEYVTSAAADLGRLGQLDVRIAGSFCESSRASPRKERGMRYVRSRPDPEIPAVFEKLIVEEKRREKGEGVRHRLAGLVPVDVRPAGPVLVGRDVEGDLGLVEREIDAAVTCQGSRERQNAAGSLEHAEQSGGVGPTPPIEVVADVAGGRRRSRDQPVDLSIQRFDVAGRDHIRHNEIAALDELPELIVADEGHARGRL